MIINKTLPLFLLQFFLTVKIEATKESGTPLTKNVPGIIARDSATPGCGQAPDICPKTKYRSYDGSCNNLKNPSWGIPQTRYSRLLPAKYGDGISTPTVARSGNPLPSARAVSESVYQDVRIINLNFTLNAMQFGQFISHDMSFAAGTPALNTCCSFDGQPIEPANRPDRCFPIEVPADDPAYSKQNISCLDFIRTITDKYQGCAGGSQAAEQLTAVNHYLDLSAVYGNSDQDNQQLRTFQGGRLISEQRNNQEWLPKSFDYAEHCPLAKRNEPCYKTGDVRANQNPQIAILQTLFLREHNRIADTLTKMNPHWDDETTFQEARKINIANYQRISYYEWLPILIGKQNAIKNKIIWQTDGWVNDYNSTSDPSVLNGHATAAFRFFHTLVAGQLNLVNELERNYGSTRLSNSFFRPAILEQNNSFDELTRGLATQPIQEADAYHDKEITLNWLRQAGQKIGQDLKAVCIQRNRDHGLASYNDYRRLSGLPRAEAFKDFLDVISKDNVDRLSALYEHPDDVDLTVGGSLEHIVPGTLTGPTFLYILTEQFHRSRISDQFWFERPGDVGFTKPQLMEIRKSSIAKIMCDNGLTIKTMQPKAFEEISPSNKVVPCAKLPSVNLSLWKD